MIFPPMTGGQEPSSASDVSPGHRCVTCPMSCYYRGVIVLSFLTPRPPFSFSEGTAPFMCPHPGSACLGPRLWFASNPVIPVLVPVVLGAVDCGPFCFFVHFPLLLSLLLLHPAIVPSIAVVSPQFFFSFPSQFSLGVLAFLCEILFGPNPRFTPWPYPFVLRITVKVQGLHRDRGIGWGKMLGLFSINLSVYLFIYVPIYLSQCSDLYGET